MSKPVHSLDDLLQLMARLRDPQTGSPWDRQQTFHTIAPYTLEEAYEVVDAIERGDFVHLEDELGDLLYQVVYHARMAEEQGMFDFSGVVNRLVDKIQRRHPDLLTGTPSQLTAEQVHNTWDQVKAQEKAEKQLGLLDGLSDNLPALVVAQKLQDKAARVNFDWPDVRPVLAKMREELDEIEEAMVSGNQDEIKGEVGDFLFAATNLARHLKVDAEQAVRGCNRKFRNRFAYIEQVVAAQGKTMDECSLEELDHFWDEAKKQGL
ncbi:nucleoside triphosphate pyrophosphohydrolase [Parendozoicomonas haliclonae]|uniref:Nucleoside triphosphate pyrophosphohydrolase n=1 Tax=Parendozoicomonas haliclonae TaxID=1960125 RepID=A0A1X7AP70_9GAMM|nr:nucleoside triphosphate pyrophosphohydrolase [Parendozoicomonas haliclonae]SMA50086.1 Nucleoside triphosphate pyrophosphohydrolase [Parendozoicomonas haliclonae]